MIGLSLLVLAVVLVAAVGQLSPVCATTKVTSNYIQNLSLDADPGRLGEHDYAKIALSGPYVHAVWVATKNDGTSTRALYYRRSTDGGQTFEPPVQIVQDTPSDFFKIDVARRWNSVVADGPYLHIFYTVGWPQQLNYIRSADNGATFDPAATFSSGFFTYDVHVTAENGHVAVGWALNGDENPHGLYCSHSSDGGATFSTTTVAYNDNYGSPGGIFRHNIVDAARSGNNVYLLTTMGDWNYCDSTSRLYLWPSVDGGATFKSPHIVNVKASNEHYYLTKIQDNYSPNLAVSGDEVHVVWVNTDQFAPCDAWAQYSLRTRRSTDGGTTLEEPVTLHAFPTGYDHGAYPGQEMITRTGNRVDVVTVKGDAPAGTFLWTSNDGGAGWSAGQRISTGGWWPQIKVRGSLVHIVNGSYFLSRDGGVTFNGGVTPYDQSLGWYYPTLALGTDGVVHYIGAAASGGNSSDDQIMYRRLTPEPAPGTADKVLQMTTTGSSRIENLQIAATPDINFSSAMTIEFWVRRLSDDDDYLERLIFKPQLSGRGSYEIGYTSEPGIYAHLATTGTESKSVAVLASGVPLPLGTWTHIAVTYDADGGADNWRMYVNGDIAGTGTVEGTIITDTLDSPLRVTCGNHLNPGQVEIDELRLWNRARTLTEIRVGLYQPLEGTEDGLTAYYNFDDTFRDMTGRGNDAMPMYFETFVDSTIVPSRKTLSVAKPGTGSGAVASTPSGINCGGTCSADFDHGVLVTLTATASVGSTFNGWTGCDSVNGNTCTVTLTTNRSVSATFTLDRHILTVTKPGTGTGTVTSSPAGIDCGATCSAEFNQGTVVALAATPATGSTLSGWTGCDSSSGNTCTVTMTSGRTITATFIVVKTLTVSRSGSGTVASAPSGISCGTACTAPFTPGTVVTLTPTPDTGNVFAYWSGACTGKLATCVVTMNTDTTVEAVFVPQKTTQNKLTITKVKTAKGDGTVTSSDGTIHCGTDCSESFYPNTPVVLTATPNADSVFTGWSGTGISCPGTGTCSVTMDKAYTVKATFIGPSLLKVQKAPKNKGTGIIASSDGAINCGEDCQESYPYNAAVTLTATPDPGSVFISWTGCDSVSANVCTVTMNKAKTAKVVFVGPSILKAIVTYQNGASGTVTSDPPGISCPGDCAEPYPYQTAVTITAVPGAGSTTVSFSGCVPATATTCLVVLDKAKTVKVTFSKPRVSAGPDAIQVFGESGGERSEVEEEQ
jgi:hypothetical protein